MKDLINTLLTTFAWFRVESGNEYSGSQAVEFARKNNLIGTKLTGSDGTVHRINVSEYRNKETGKYKEALWINAVSKDEIDSTEMVSKYGTASA